MKIVTIWWGTFDTEVRFVEGCSCAPGCRHEPAGKAIFETIRKHV